MRYVLRQIPFSPFASNWMALSVVIHEFVTGMAAYSQDREPALWCCRVRCAVQQGCWNAKYCHGSLKFGCCRRKGEWLIPVRSSPLLLLIPSLTHSESSCAAT